MSPNVLRVYIGYDPRQSIAYNVLQHSISIRSKKPCAITPLVIETLPIKKEGLTPFTYSRFLVPWLTGFKGWALFLDADILVLDDVGKLFALADDKYAAMVSKNPLKFEWASVILYNCAHPANAILTPEYIEYQKTTTWLDWLPEELVGDLPREWNHLVGYDAPRDDAKLVHFTQGIPCHPEVAGCEYSEAWITDYRFTFMTLPWGKVMGQSVHATTQADGTLIAKLRKAKRDAA